LLAKVWRLTAVQLVSQLPSTVNPQTITLSNDPRGSDAKKVGDIARFKVSQVGLRQD
jgi:nuclear protein localization family protein 4